MPYVPPELKERIKREVSIQRLAEARGIKLRSSGKELIGLCPFHKDTRPSLNIDPVKNVWDCKGACGEGGDVISWGCGPKASALRTPWNCSSGIIYLLRPAPPSRRRSKARCPSCRPCSRRRQTIKSCWASWSITTTAR